MQHKKKSATETVVNQTSEKPTKETETVSISDLSQQLERQKRQIEMCFAMLYETLDKYDNDFHSFVKDNQPKSPVIGFRLSYMKLNNDY